MDIFSALDQTDVEINMWIPCIINYLFYLKIKTSIKLKFSKF